FPTRRSSDLLRMRLSLQCVESCADHVVRVRRTHGLCNNVLNAERLEHCTHRATGDDTGTCLGSAKQNASCAVTASNVVVERTAIAQRHENQIALCAFGRLADCFRHFTSLAVTEANATLLVADDDECGEAEATATLHHLGDAIDVYELINETVVALFAVTITIAAAFPTFLCHCPGPYFF